MEDSDQQSHVARIGQVIRSLEGLQVLRDLYGNLRMVPPENLEDATTHLEDCVGLLLAQLRLQGKSFQECLTALVAQLKSHGVTPEAGAAVAQAQGWRDSSTGLCCGDYLRDILPIEFERAKRYGHPLTCVMIAVDHLDEVSATEGAEAAAGLLLDLAQAVRANTRQCDLCCQVDARTLLALLPHTTIEGTIALANRLRAIAAQVGITSAQRRDLTLSLGGYAMANNNAVSAEDLLGKAQAALEEARQRGGNNACMRGGYRWDLAHRPPAPAGEAQAKDSG